MPKQLGAREARVRGAESMSNEWGFRAVMLGVLLAAACSGSGPGVEISEDELNERAARLAHQFIIVDTHIDVPDRIHQEWEDISERTAKGDFDYPRAKQGGLDAAFMSIYVSASYQDGRAKARADELIDLVEGFASRWPEKFALARSVDELRRNFSRGVISLPMGMENGAPVEGKLENLRHFYDRGIRYVTLTHSRANHICDSSYDPQRKWGGLSPFGREVVAEMNRLGMMIDISHVSDDTFQQVIELTQAPPIASHSSCRHFTPGWERNMSDEMIQKLAEKGGVIQIAWGSSFISEAYRQASESLRGQVAAYLDEHELERGSSEAQEYIERYRQQNPLPLASVSDVVDHIDHVVKLAGADHVGFGSDFDGVGDSLPTGLKDVSYYPNLVAEMLRRGYSEEDIAKICGGNLLRVWSEVERVAQQLQTEG